MEHLGFYVCVNDLEDDLIRAGGTAGVEALFDSQGDLGSFRSFAEPARLARPRAGSADAAVPGQRLEPQAALSFRRSCSLRVLALLCAPRGQSEAHRG